MFEGDFADTCARKVSLVSMVGQACADGERGPPFAWVEISDSMSVGLKFDLWVLSNAIFAEKYFQDTVFLIQEKIMASWQIQYILTSIS